MSHRLHPYRTWGPRLSRAPGVSARHALFVRAPLEPDDRVLIQGTSGVALFALQFAHAAGVRCIVLSSCDDKLERARKLGASYLINYRDTPDWHLAVQEITRGEGATHILEVGGQETYERSMQCLAPNGTIAQIGVLTGFDLRPNLCRFPVSTRISSASKPVHANISKV